jgi:hypothetical protein
MLAPAVTAASIRRIAVVLGALSLLTTIGVLWSDRFMAMGTEHPMSVREAWRAGLIQGFFLLNLLLGVAAIGVWCLKSWARWIALAWFPLLAVHNITTEFWHTHSVQAESWFHAIFLSALWVGALYRFLAARQAAALFHRDTA